MRSVLSFLVLFTFCFSTSFKASANLKGNWIHHAGACFFSTDKESQVHKIIEGNKYVYFVMRGSSFNRNTSRFYATQYGIDPLQIFYYDKSLPWKKENVRTFANDFETSGTIPNVMEYSPTYGALVVIYDNNKMDILHDDGNVHHSDFLYNITSNVSPTTPYSITFDLEKPVFYLGTSLGYMVFDLNTGECIQTVKLDKSVTWALRLGDKMVVVAGNGIAHNSYNTLAYCIPANGSVSSLAGYELRLNGNMPDVKINGNMTVPNLQALMPLSDTSFAAVAEYNADTNYNLILITLSGSSFTGKVLVSKGTFDNASASNLRHIFRTDGRTGNMADGYMISDSANLHFLTFGSDAVQTVSKSSLESTEKAAKTATLDGKKVWFQTYNPSSFTRGYYSREISDDNNWGAKSEILMPNSSTTFIPTYMAYHPERGLLFRGPGAYFGSDGENDFFCAYKDGLWTDISYSNNSKYFGMSYGQRYIGIDPIHPDWIWGNFITMGLLRMDIGDYTNALMYGTEARKSWETNGTYPGYFAAYPEQPNYQFLCSFSNVSFDVNNTMWMSRDIYFKFSNAYAYRYETDGYIPFLYLTAEEREANAKIGNDKSKLIMPHEIRFPGLTASASDRFLALKSKGNENILVHTNAYFTEYSRFCKIYDHNGTLEDTSDDRYVILTDLVDDRGERFLVSREYDIYEDPYRGELWLTTLQGPIIINPKEALQGSKKMRRLHISKRDGMEVDEYPFEQVVINCITDDKFGRKWLGTETGLYCLSQDSEEILGFYHTENSPLPSNVIYAVGCDLANGSIFVTTNKGLIEFQPEGVGILKPGTHLSIWPSTVTPEYKGHVTLSSADASSEYVIFDEGGNQVKSLGKSTDGTLQWDVRDENGERVAAGKYNIQRKDTSETNTVIVL